MPAPKKPVPGPLLSLAEIQAVDDLKTKTVPIPEWNGSVIVREFTAQQSLDIAEADGGEEVMQLVYGMQHPPVDDAGAKALLAKSGSALVRIIDAIRELNESGEEAVDQAERFPVAEPS